MSTIDRLGQTVGDTTPSVGSSAPNASLAIKTPVRAATTANITLSGAQTIDGVAVVADDRVLVMAQTSAVDNGIYLASTGNWTRTTDLDGANDVVKGTQVFINEGTANGAKTSEVTSNDPITVGTSSMAWSAPASALSLLSSAMAVTIDGGGATILAGYQTSMQVPFACTISKSTLLSDAVGNLVMDIKKTTFAGYPTATSIVAAAPPTLTAAQSAQDSTLTGWTLSLAAGDILEFYVTSIATITKATLSLQLLRA